MADLTVPLSSTLDPEVLKALMDKYPQLASQPSAAEQVVAAASKPGTASTAEQAAEVFKNAAPNGPGSAAESAGVFEAGGEIGAPGVEAGKELVPLGERGLVPTATDAARSAATSSAEDGAIALGQGAGDQLPAIIEKAGLPALAEGTGAVAARGLGRLASKAIPVAGQAAMVADAIHGKLADPNDFQGIPVPGHPGYLAKGPDIVKDPNIPDEDRASAGTSLFDRVSAAIKRHTPDMTANPSRSPADLTPPTAEEDETPTKPGVNPLVERYLRERADMADAQKAASANTFGAQMARAEAQLAHSIAGAPGKVDDTQFQSLEANAQSPVENIKTQQAAHQKTLQNQMAEIQAQQLSDENDPNSAHSAKTRAAYAPLLKMTGLDPESIQGLSAADIKSTVEKPIEFAAKIQELREAAAMRRTILNSNREDKMKHQDEVEGAAIGKDLNDVKASSRSVLGLASKAKMQAGRLLKIVNDPEATSRDLNSAYADLKGIVSGMATISGTEHQSYHNLATQIADGLSWIDGHPHAPEIPAIKQHVADMTRQMTAISDQIINHNTASVQASHANWIKRHPDEWQKHLEVVNNAASMGNAPSPSPAGGVPAAAHPDTPAAIAWAKNNLGDPRAQEILKRAGLQ